MPARIDTTLFDRIKKELEQIRPFLQADGGDVTLEEITPDLVVKVRLWGACCSCSMSPMTMQAGIEEAVKKAFPEIREVIAINEGQSK
ncbi:MAG: NifU family protein [Flavobacteriales bacterium]|nr:NifU family protein [Flavobacteriales bacterium]